MSKVFILTDETVSALWLANFKERLALQDTVDIVVPAGETYKTLETAQMIWSKLMEHHANRQSLLYNLGGGTVTDLGGFAASCFKRGIDFINVPTTLLAMVDAAIGGKTGVNFGELKNQIGTFAKPKDILFYYDFLTTLPSRDIRSGLAELLKYGFIADESLLKVNECNYLDAIEKAVALKNAIVSKDPFEKYVSGMPASDSRMVLNFGHTFGHAIESVSLDTNHPLRHGEAVSLGMWCALWLSNQRLGLPMRILHEYEPQLAWILEESGYGSQDVKPDAILSLLVHDKKTVGDRPRFVLLSSVGRPTFDGDIPDSILYQCLEQLQDVLSHNFMPCQ